MQDLLSGWLTTGCPISGQEARPTGRLVMSSNGSVQSERFVIPVAAAELELQLGDITKVAVDAIVNAANSMLVGGGGVDGAIHRAGGPSLMNELDKIRARIGSCQTGSAVVTGAGRLPAKYVFHAVGPRYRDGHQNEPELLKSCYTTCLDLASERNLESISFPSISTGIYGYPISEAASIAIGSVKTWLSTNKTPLKLVKLIQFSEADHTVYRKQMGDKA